MYFVSYYGQGFYTGTDPLDKGVAQFATKELARAFVEIMRNKGYTVHFYSGKVRKFFNNASIPSSIYLPQCPLVDVLPMGNGSYL